jgi:hypothetical protein
MYMQAGDFIWDGLIKTSEHEIVKQYVRSIQSPGIGAAGPVLDSVAAVRSSLRQRAASPAIAWSVFHFGYSAPQYAPNRMKVSFTFNHKTLDIVLFDASAPVRLC